MHLTHVSTVTLASLASLIKRITQQRGKGRTKREYPSPSLPARSGSQMGQGTNYVPKPPPKLPQLTRSISEKEREGRNPKRAICSQESSPATTAWCQNRSRLHSLQRLSLRLLYLGPCFPPSGHSEPAPTSAPSTGCLLLLSCG
jgi:hypothetical protein